MSKILLITILVAVHTNYISCKTDLTIYTCKSDQDFVNKLKEGQGFLVPVLLVKNENEDPLKDANTKSVIQNYYEERDIANLIVVPADTCVVSDYCLNDNGTGNQYPLMLMIISQFLVPEKVTKISKHSLNQLVTAAFDFKLPKVVLYNFVDRLELSMSVHKFNLGREPLKAPNIKKHSIAPTSSVPSSSQTLKKGVYQGDTQSTVHARKRIPVPKHEVTQTQNLLNTMERWNENLYYPSGSPSAPVRHNNLNLDLELGSLYKKQKNG